MKIKQETPTNAEAFEYYFTIGDNRSYEKTAEHFKVTKTTIQNWAESFNWQQRVELRNKEINKAIEERSKKENIEQKAKMIADVDAALTIYRQALSENLNIIKKQLEKIAKSLQEDPNKPVELIFDRIKNTKQFSELARSLDQIMTLRMKLTGDIIQKELTIKLPDDIDI